VLAEIRSDALIPLAALWRLSGLVYRTPQRITSKSPLADLEPLLVYIKPRNAFAQPLCAQRAMRKTMCYVPRASNRDCTLSINGRMPSSLEIARDSSRNDLPLVRSPSFARFNSMSA